MLLIVGAKIFGYYLTLEKIPHMITSSLLAFTDSPIVFLLFINILLLSICMFIEEGVALIILGPLLIPAANQFGIDPIHFGVVIIINIMISGVTPPFDSMMFTTCSIVGVKIGDFIKEIISFLIALLIMLILFTVFPPLSTFIPNLFG